MHHGLHKSGRETLAYFLKLKLKFCVVEKRPWCGNLDIGMTPTKEDHIKGPIAIWGCSLTHVATSSVA